MRASSNESHGFLDIDYHLALVNGPSSDRGDLIRDDDDPCLDLMGLEWNKFDFEPELFLPTDTEDEPNVEYLMRIVEELQRENQQLRQKVEQLSTDQ